jgi:hypothetical protein
MEFEFHCSCGKSHAIATSQAGTTLTCVCGREHVLPSLSELRRSAGIPVFQKSTSDSVWDALNSGDIEFGDRCLQCGDATDDLHAVWAICERSYLHVSGGVQLAIGGLIPVAEKELHEEHRGRDVVVPLLMRMCKPCANRYMGGWLNNALRIIGWLFVAVALGIILLALARPVARIQVPLILSPPLLLAAVAMHVIKLWLESKSQAGLKATVCKVPDYERLLSEYPHAELAVARAEATTLPAP